MDVIPGSSIILAMSDCISRRVLPTVYTFAYYMGNVSGIHSAGRDPFVSHNTDIFMAFLFGFTAAGLLPLLLFLTPHGLGALCRLTPRSFKVATDILWLLGGLVNGLLLLGLVPRALFLCPILYSSQLVLARYAGKPRPRLALQLWLSALLVLLLQAAFAIPEPLTLRWHSENSSRHWHVRYSGQTWCFARGSPGGLALVAYYPFSTVDGMDCQKGARGGAMVVLSRALIPSPFVQLKNTVIRANKGQTGPLLLATSSTTFENVQVYCPSTPDGASNRTSGRGSHATRACLMLGRGTNISGLTIYGCEASGGSSSPNCIERMNFLEDGIRQAISLQWTSGPAVELDLHASGNVITKGTPNNESHADDAVPSIFPMGWLTLFLKRSLMQSGTMEDPFIMEVTQQYEPLWFGLVRHLWPLFSILLQFLRLLAPFFSLFLRYFSSVAFEPSLWKNIWSLFLDYIVFGGLLHLYTALRYLLLVQLPLAAFLWSNRSLVTDAFYYFVRFFHLYTETGLLSNLALFFLQSLLLYYCMKHKSRLPYTARKEKKTFFQGALSSIFYGIPQFVTNRIMGGMLNNWFMVLFNGPFVNYLIRAYRQEMLTYMFYNGALLVLVVLLRYMPLISCLPLVQTATLHLLFGTSNVYSLLIFYDKLNRHSPVKAAPRLFSRYFLRLRKLLFFSFLFLVRMLLVVAAYKVIEEPSYSALSHAYNALCTALSLSALGLLVYKFLLAPTSTSIPALTKGGASSPAKVDAPAYTNDSDPGPTSQTEPTQASAKVSHDF